MRRGKGDVYQQVDAMRMIDDATDFIHATDGRLPPPYPGHGHPQEAAYPPGWNEEVLSASQRRVLAMRRLRDAEALGALDVPTLDELISNVPDWAVDP